jgi:hypothetical protein
MGHMSESKDKKSNKYFELALMISYFFIPFFGLKSVLKTYLREDALPFAYFLLLLFIGGNIMTCLIFILNDKSLRTKSFWTAGLLMVVLVLNYVVS